MIIAGEYSFNGGKEYIEKNFPDLLREVKTVIKRVDAITHKNKTSKEKTMPGSMLYSPVSLNKAFKIEFAKFEGWSNKKELCDYPQEFYLKSYKPKVKHKVTVKPYRDMDFVKNKLGVEIQFGKYAFMVYNVCAKMTIFHKLGYINAGIEVVPIKQLASEMSTGVSYFEQFVWDLQQRGVSDIDIPVLILGIDDVYK
ncbi:MAG TPA: BglII/BstYI family type II restriction endonuclease [Bacteroidia bacterium]|nr:BglII/BstYI family type II restriction endonuclease [Bacteroidia bacterium]HNU34504.1 BglII/BstYI family type II restriction endonuclease [Bacteroidia bacterium]